MDQIKKQFLQKIDTVADNQSCEKGCATLTSLKKIGTDLTEYDKEREIVKERELEKTREKIEKMRVKNNEYAMMFLHDNNLNQKSFIFLQAKNCINFNFDRFALKQDFLK